MLDWQWALAIVAGGVVTAQVPYLLATSLTGAIFRLPLNTISLGTGPTLFKLRIGGITFRAAAFPFGGYVQFRDTEENKPHAPGTYATAPWWQRFICAIIGAVAMIASTAPLLGADTIAVAFSALQFVADLIERPLQTVDLTAGVMSVKEARGVWGAIAHVVAFTGGLQFLPLGFLAGGTAIISLAEAFHGGLLPDGLLGHIYRWSFVVLLLLLAFSIIAIVR